MKMKAASTVHFIAIWVISGLVLNLILPENVKYHQGFWPSFIIGFLLSVGISLYRFRRKAKANLQSENGFQQLPPQQKLKRFLRKLNTPRYIIAGFFENFVLFVLLGYAFLPNTQKVTEFWICILYGIVLASFLTLGKMMLFWKWKQDHK